MHCPQHKENALRLVNLLNNVHPFLLPEETEETFCVEFNYGSIVECYRTMFSKNPIWWKNGSHFREGWKFGLPAQLKPYFYLMGVKLNKGEEKDPHSCESVMFDCRNN